MDYVMNNISNLKIRNYNHDPGYDNRFINTVDSYKDNFTVV